MIFESHAHYDDEAFNEDREELLSRLQEEGIQRVINVCADIDQWDGTVALMEKYPFIYGAVGTHPDYAAGMNEEKMEELRILCRHEKTAAVGEIGLDYYWDQAAHDVQIYWFQRQLELAREEKLPVIIHSREAAKDTLDVAKSSKLGEIGGVIHCFSYEKEMAREYLNMGLYLGIGGVVTFKNSRKLKEVAAYAPIESILLETDSPYLAPVPFRGKRNSSLNLPYVVQTLSEIKGISPEEVMEITKENAYRLFKKVKR